MRIDQAIVVGCGGTGSHLLEPLARLLAFHPDGIKHSKPGMILVDGDRFEPHNGSRQVGTRSGAYKANVALNRIRDIAPDAVDVCRYVDAISFKEVVLDGLKGTLMVVLSVDNHASRKEILTALHGLNAKNMLVLNPGNDLSHGQVHVWARVDGRDITPYPLATDPDGNALHPELLNPGDRIPGGCMAQAPSTPQLIVANASAALACLMAAQAWLDDEPFPDEVCFDAREFKLVPSGGLVEIPKLEPVAAVAYTPGPGSEPPYLDAN